MSRLGYIHMQLESAWLSLSMARFRSFLAGLGVTIGVAAVILVIGVGEGSRKKILDQIQSLGSNLLVINPGAASTGPAANARVNGVEYEVIGVLEPKGDFGWFHPDQLVLAPLRLAQRQILGIDYVHAITVKVFSGRAMQDARDEIVRVLRVKHRLNPVLGKDQLDFNVVSQTELIQAFNKVNRTFTSLLASIAVISLLVGGIGIMNIMLANLSERIGEIGIRKAVGARRTDILWQFMFESLTITTAGAGLGVLLGIAAAVMLENVSSWQTEIRAWSVLAGVGFASLVGLAFGIYPAWRASGLDPMEALRKE